MFGGKDKKKEEGSSSSYEPCKTGGEIDACVANLIAKAYDKVDGVRVEINNSLREIGLRQPELVLSSCVSFVSKRSSQIELEHRIQILTVMGTVLEDKRNAIGKELGKSIVSFAAAEMVASEEVKVEWQTPASNILVLLSVPFCDAVIDELVKYYQPGVIPHYFVVKTLADVAAANGVQFTLRMKDVLPRVTPCLGAVKKAPIKWVFAAALGRFAEAIQYFNQNASAEEKAKVQTGLFSTDMSSAFDVLFTKWIASTEAKVRFAVAESLGYMCATMDRSTFEDRASKLIPVYLQMFKKEKPSDHLPIANGLCAVMVESVTDGGKSIEPTLSLILQGIHPMLCRPPDVENAQTAAKTHNALLRCFEVVARPMLETTLNFVINRFQMKEAPTRIGSLVILRHFVNSLNDILEDKKPLIMSSVITMLNEPNLAVKKSIMQLIVSMANNDYLPLEGGQQLVKFICQQCALPAEVEKKGEKPKAPPAGGDPTPGQIRLAGNHILLVMATKVRSTHEVLWPYLLELLALKEFDPALVVLCKSIGALAQAKRDDGDQDYMIDFKANVNLPSPQIIAARLMISASTPFAEKEMGVSILQCMVALGPILQPQLGKFWDENIPELLATLQDEEDFNKAQWPETLLKVWKASLNVVEDKGWVRDLCTALSDLFVIYNENHEQKRVLFRYLGVVLSKLDAKAQIGSTLDLMIAKVNHANDLQRQGFAQGMGLCGFTHLDTVLPKLTDLLGPKKPVAEKKSGGLFGFGGGGGDKKDGKPAAGDGVTATVLLSYGYVAAYANTELILSRLDVHIMHNLLPVLASAKTGAQIVKVNVIKAIDLIGKALHISRLPENKKDFKLQVRDQLIQGIMGILDGSKGTTAEFTSLKLLALNAASTLTNLQPPVSAPIRDSVLDTVLPFYTLFTDSAPPPPEENVNADALEKAEGTVVEQLMTNINTFLVSLIQMDPTVSNFVAVLKKLDKYVFSAKAVERERASSSFLIVCKKFIAKAVHEKSPQVEKALPDVGGLVGRLIARTCDSSTPTRLACTDAIQAILYIDQVLENPDDSKPAQEIKLISEIKSRVAAEEVAERVAAMNDLAAMITTVITIDETIGMLKSAPTGLSDPDADGALGSAEFIKGVIIQKGTDLGPAVVDILRGFVEAVKAIDRENVSKETLTAIRNLATYHFEACINALLETRVPLPAEVVKSFIALCTGDQSMSLQTIKHLFTVLNETAMDKDKPSPLVMTATSALCEILKEPAVKDLIEGSYPALFSSLLMRIGTAHGVDSGASSKDAVKCLQTFLNALKEDVMLKDLESKNVWAEMETGGYDDAVTKAASIFCTVHGDKKRALIKFLAKFYSQQSHPGQRVVATALLAEFVNHSADDAVLLKELIKFLLPRVADKIEKVRKQALRGLGNLVAVWSDEVSESASAVLSALTSASEDTDAEVAAEAVASLTRVVEVVDEETIGPMLINICFRMRPAFDRKNTGVRGAAFTLFGALVRFGEFKKGSSNPGLKGLVNNFIDQVHTNIPIFIVHLADDEKEVREKCLGGFKKVAELLPAEVRAVIMEATPDVDQYENFIAKISPLLGSHFPERLRGYVDSCIDYYNSHWTSIRGHSAYFSAMLVAKASEENRKSISTHSLCEALIKLLSHPEPSVRSKAAKAMSLLYDI